MPRLLTKSASGRGVAAGAGVFDGTPAVEMAAPSSSSSSAHPKATRQVRSQAGARRRCPAANPSPSSSPVRSITSGDSSPVRSITFAMQRCWTRCKTAQ